MRTRSVRSAGFTLIEMTVVVVIIAVLAAAAIWVPRVGRERAEISNSGVELQALLHQARQTALSEGVDVVVMFFPTYANPVGGVGRVIVYRDTDSNFLTGGSLAGYNPASPAAAAGDEVLEVLDLSTLVDFGAISTAALPTPYDTIPVSSACTFCGADRGAIRFNARGRALFYNQSPPAQQVVGGSVSLAVRAQGGVRPIAESRTIAVTATTGSVRTFVR